MNIPSNKNECSFRKKDSLTPPIFRANGPSQIKKPGNRDLCHLASAAQDGKADKALEVGGFDSIQRPSKRRNGMIASK